MKYVITTLALINLAACNIQVNDGSSSDTGSGDATSSAKAAAPGACEGDYMIGKEYKSSVAGQQNSMGQRKMSMDSKCQLTVTNCNQVLKFPENYEIRRDTTLHAILQVEVTGTTGWDHCMGLGIKTCDVSLYNFGTFTTFWMSCSGESATYSGSLNN